ncbi:MAG: nickel-dependent lactate racemase [Lachnospiraceae bacterium]|nr:nickel-dependent lactate racemase [Lachnospiraceae bacterium]
MRLEFPYGRTMLETEIPEARLAGVLRSGLHEYVPEADEETLVRQALASPEASAPLHTLASGKKNIVILCSDHTRPVPSRVIIPAMLGEIRKGNPEAEITLLIATGCHRETRREELADKFGEEILRNERIVIHDCDDEKNLVTLGKLPSGGELVINRIAVEADLLTAEGFIEPHFFAGFSGGRKSVLPGIAARKTVLYNHNAGFIAHPKARTGVIEGNPIHEDMLYAARKAGLAFIVNVVINAEKKVIYAAAGDTEAAHKKGREFLGKLARVPAVPADIVITTNGGYPLDQNIYQAVKGMTAAEACVRPGGVTIMAAESSDGAGGESFLRTFREEKDLSRMTEIFLRTPPEETIVDQWQSQIFARVMMRSAVIFISEAPDETVRDFGMIPAHSMAEALEKADQILAQKGILQGKILAIPDGVSVIVGEA